MTVLDFVDEVKTALTIDDENIEVVFFNPDTKEHTTTYAEMVKDVSFYRHWSITGYSTNKVQFVFFYNSKVKENEQ